MSDYMLHLFNLNSCINNTSIFDECGSEYRNIQLISKYWIFTTQWHTKELGEKASSYHKNYNKILLVINIWIFKWWNNSETHKKLLRKKSKRHLMGICVNLINSLYVIQSYYRHTFFLKLQAAYKYHNLNIL